MKRLLAFFAALALLPSIALGSGFSTAAAAGGSGTVTSVGVTTANGVSGTVANPTTTPAITVSLGALTPTSVAASGTVTGSNVSGTNTGDQTITLTGDVTGTGTGSFATTAVSATGNGTDFVVASPNRLKVSGNASLPTAASTDAYVLHNTADGLVVAGNGSSFDFMLVGSGGSSLATVAHGGSTLAVSPGGLSAAGSILSSGGTSGIGYATGAGGAVTQLTSRTTGVTNNKACGAITMFSAAGSATWATFTVTDSAVAATDTIIANEKSGTNLYLLSVTAVAAGSFNLSFATTGGTATDAPVINYCVIKGVAA